MARTVYGYITDKNGDPAANVRVKAMDKDPWWNPDDLMGMTMTGSNGYYEIHYEGGHWDPAPHWWTIWRPDIYIRVSAPVNGRCDDGEWKPDKNWIHLRDSSVTSNHPHRNNLRKDLQLPNYPLDPVMVHTFQRGIDMWSEVNFFFHYTAFGCAPNGDKIEWSGWGFGGPPKIATRCWTTYEGHTKCKKADQEKIRSLGYGPYPVELTGILLSHLIESDEVDEDAEDVLRSALIELQEYISDSSPDRAREGMESFKRSVHQQGETGAITELAEKVLQASADRFLEARK